MKLVLLSTTLYANVLKSNLLEIRVCVSDDSSTALIYCGFTVVAILTQVEYTNQSAVLGHLAARWLSG